MKLYADLHTMFPDGSERVIDSWSPWTRTRRVGDIPERERREQLGKLGHASTSEQLPTRESGGEPTLW